MRAPPPFACVSNQEHGPKILLTMDLFQWVFWRLALETQTLETFQRSWSLFSKLLFVFNVCHFCLTHFTGIRRIFWFLLFDVATDHFLLLFCFTPWSDRRQVLRVCCPPVAVLSVQFMLEGAGVFRTNWRRFMAILWRVNLLPSRSLVNFFTFFYITMLQPWLISHTPETNPVLPPWHKPSWAVSFQVAVWVTLGDTKPFG